MSGICGFILLVLIPLTLSQTVPYESPCPQVFEYEPTTEALRWYGKVRLTSDYTLYGVWLDVILDRRAKSIGNWLGEVSTSNNVEYKIENRSRNIYPNSPLNVRFFIEYDVAVTVPKLKTIRLNGREICTDRGNSQPENRRSYGSPFSTSSRAPYNHTAIPLHNDDYPSNNNRNKNSSWLTSDENTDDDRYTIRNRNTTRPGTASNFNDDRYNTDRNSNSGRPTSNSNSDDRYSNTDRDRNSGRPTSDSNFNDDRYSNTNANRNRDSTRQTSPKYNDDRNVNTDRNTGSNVGSSQNGRQPLGDNSNRRPTQNSRQPSGNTNYFELESRTNRYPQDSYSYNRDEYESTTKRTTLTTPARRRPSNNNFDYNDNLNRNNPRPSNDYYEGDFALPDSAKIRPTPLPEMDTSDDQCGKVAIRPRPLIVGGETTVHGQWPWHVALFQAQTTGSSKYICGGTLISKSHMITAAHCVTRRSSERAVDPQTLTVYLGKYNLRKSSDSVQIMLVRRIFVHPQYNSSNFYADLGILKFTKPSDYTQYVRHICLWKDDDIELENIIDRDGTVVGWGFDEQGQVTDDLTLVKMPVVKQTTCLWSFKEFYTHFTSEQSYCAGYENGTSVCNGDSGGGMVFPDNGSLMPTWRLRGIVSISVAKQFEYKCDPYHYVVFTDSAQFLPWIKEKLLE